MSSEENNGHRNTVGQIRLSLRGTVPKKVISFLYCFILIFICLSDFLNSLVAKELLLHCTVVLVTVVVHSF